MSKFSFGSKIYFITVEDFSSVWCRSNVGEVKKCLQIAKRPLTNYSSLCILYSAKIRVLSKNLISNSELASWQPFFYYVQKSGIIQKHVRQLLKTNLNFLYFRLLQQLFLTQQQIFWCSTVQTVQIVISQSFFICLHSHISVLPHLDSRFGTDIESTGNFCMANGWQAITDSCHSKPCNHVRWMHINYDGLYEIIFLLT